MAMMNDTTSAPPFANGSPIRLPPFVPYAAASGILRLRYTPLRMTADVIRAETDYSA
jgi:hypothetical protein